MKMLLLFLSICILFCSLVCGFVPTYYAALGDSYATGNGAGDLTGILCGRFSGAYPVLVADQLALAFNNLACAGAFTSTVLATQVPFAGNRDVVTVQVGGNEADFFSVLNECVIQWVPLSSCDQELVRARSIIESSSFIERYDDFISETQRRLGPGTKLLVLGYAQFFNDQTEQCNHITFSRTDPNDLLTKAKRRALNQLIRILNAVIQASAEAQGASYVDIDTVFQGHRFCEEGVLEPLNSASWFFRDIAAPWYSALISNTNLHRPSGPSGGFLELTRTFHPTLDGHAAIAKVVVANMLNG